MCNMYFCYSQELIPAVGILLSVSPVSAVKINIQRSCENIKVYRENIITPKFNKLISENTECNCSALNSDICVYQYFFASRNVWVSRNIWKHCFCPLTPIPTKARVMVFNISHQVHDQANLMRQK